MNPAIEKLVLVITALCLRINALRLFDVSMDLHPRAGLYAICWKPGVKVTEPGAHVHKLEARLDYSTWDWLTPAQQHAQAIAELEAMAARLQDILGTAPTQHEKPPAEATTQPSTWIEDESLAAITRLAGHGGIAELRLNTGQLSHTAVLQVEKIDQPNGYGIEATLSTGKQRHSLSLGVTDGIYAARLCEWVETIAAGRLATAA